MPNTRQDFCCICAINRAIVLAHCDVQQLTKDREELLAFYDFPGGGLGAYPDDEPDRVDIFDGQATKQESA